MHPGNPQFDQSLADIRDTMPPLWFALYEGCMKVGFEPKMAMALVQTWILSQNPNGIRPDNPLPPLPPEDE